MLKDTTTPDGYYVDADGVWNDKCILKTCTVNLIQHIKTG